MAIQSAFPAKPTRNLISRHRRSQPFRVPFLPNGSLCTPPPGDQATALYLLGVSQTDFDRITGHYVRTKLEAPDGPTSTAAGAVPDSEPVANLLGKTTGFYRDGHEICDTF